jgi:site-specific DNA-methyltransferase (adenine-specific)
MLNQTTSQPDILEVIADLSNDEVFTPPKVANAVLDLLPEEVWSDPDLRWLDPGTKTGVFLREVTRRLMIGLAEFIDDEQERLDHILHNMVFGIAITELTAQMSRRTLYCSKDATGPHSASKMPAADGNVWFGRVEHAFGKNGRCTECSASRSQMERDNRENYAYGFIHADGRQQIDKEFDVKFDVIIGNPPYQMEDAGHGSSASTIYHRFVEQAIALDPKYVVMITPSRWFAGGKGVDQYRDKMLTAGRVRKIVDYPNATELFPSVDIKGGVSYFLWDRDHSGPCDFTSVRGGQASGPDARELDEFDVLVRDGRGLAVLRKVLATGDPTLSDVVSARWPFGTELTSNFSAFHTTKKPGDIRLYMQGGRDDAWITPEVVTRNADLIDEWKVLLPKAGPGNSGGHVVPDMVLGRPIVSEPGSACTLTYLVAGPFGNEDECLSFSSYVRTKFVRFLVSLRKPSQDAPRGVYTWVPQQTWDRTWTDEELYAKYGITEDEQAYIAEMIREMET